MNKAPALEVHVLSPSPKPAETPLRAAAKAVLIIVGVLLVGFGVNRLARSLVGLELAVRLNPQTIPLLPMIDSDRNVLTLDIDRGETEPDRAILFCRDGNCRMWSTEYLRPDQTAELRLAPFWRHVGEPAAERIVFRPADCEILVRNTRVNWPPLLGPSAPTFVRVTAAGGCLLALP